MDSGYTLLRAARPDGTLREVRIYHDFSDRPDTLRLIRLRLLNYRHPAAQPYQPERAALFLRGPLDPAAPGLAPQPWPLEPEVLAGMVDALGTRVMTAMPLSGEPLARALAAMPAAGGATTVRLADSYIAVMLVPWLPGVDYSEELRAAYPGGR